MLKIKKNSEGQKMVKFFAQKSQGFEKMDKNKCPIFKTPGILATTSFQNVF